LSADALLCNEREIGMNRNEGTVDRAVRAIVGLALVGATLAGMIGAWGWIGVVPLLTAAVGWCPVYTLLGVNTCGTAR
jgi:hypothetical protein